MPEIPFLQAFEGTNTRIPVWFMRQAGRYMPEYQALKKNHSLNALFRDPATASEVTLLPIRLLDVDAAILFADILTLPADMGFDIDFLDGKGPVIGNALRTIKDVARVRDFEDLAYVGETIRLVNKELPAHIPLIGFAGAPFTLATYLIEGGSSVGLKNTIRLMQTEPDTFTELMQVLTRNIIRYIKLQEDAGIKAFQLFDTWAGVLRVEDYRRFVLPYIKDIFDAVSVPSIYFLKNCAHLVEDMTQCGADGLSVCETVDIGRNAVLKASGKCIQGNLYHGLLYADRATLAREVKDLVTKARANHTRYIFNLSHGILPDISFDNVKFVAELVHEHSWNQT